MPAGSGLFSTSAARKAHLVRPGRGVASEIDDLRRDLQTTLGPLAGLAVDEFTNPAAASTTSIKTAAATVTTAVTFDAAALNGAIGSGVISPPRNITVTTAGGTPADAPTTATINGTDINGAALTEALAVSQLAATVAGLKAFAKVTSIVLTAGDGVGATLAFGTGDKIGLSAKIKTRAGLTTVLMEIEAGVKVTTGTFADATVGAPNGTYLAALVPDGARDYALYYDSAGA